MSKWLARLSTEPTGALQWLELESMPTACELVPIAKLLYDACAVVDEEARAKSLAIVVVPVDDSVYVRRMHVVFVVAALLRTAIRLTPEGGRVAVTAQEIEQELVFAVYDSARGSAAIRFNYVASEAALVLGGRVWSTRAPEGNLALFSLPLSSEPN